MSGVSTFKANEGRPLTQSFRPQRQMDSALNRVRADIKMLKRCLRVLAGVLPDERLSARYSEGLLAGIASSDEGKVVKMRTPQQMDRELDRQKRDLRRLKNAIRVMVGVLPDQATAQVEVEKILTEVRG